MPDLILSCIKLLPSIWASIENELIKNSSYNAVDDIRIRSKINKCINSKTKTYRYVLPTQLVAKLADSSLDSRCLQAGRGGTGDFDARSVCDKVIVPFDKANHDVLGGAPEPYVSNPLRVPEISKAYEGGKKDKEGWNNLSFILNIVEKKQSLSFTEAIFRQILIEVHKRLSIVHITYPVPKRISLKQTQELIGDYISVPSGGDRALTMISALLNVIGTKFRLFSEVRRSKITAADAPSGMVADIECYDLGGKISLAVEVKDKELIINHIESKLPSMRAKQVSEILYIAQRGIRKENGENIKHLVQKEFASGQNIYIFNDIVSFSSSLLAIIGEQGRRRFLEQVGYDLDKYSVAIQHKRDWADLLASI